MKHSHISALTLTASLGLFCTAQGAVIFSDDFSAYSDGDSVTGATAVGPGTWNNNGSVTVNAANQLLLEADGGRDSVEVTSGTSATCGVMSFGLAFLGDSDTAVADTDIFFVQLTSGGRSTNANPIPGFANTLDAGVHNISTDANALSTVKYFFNTSGNAFDYLAPNGSTQTIADGTYEYWVDTTLVNGNGTATTNGTATPASVSTFVVNTFNGQLGESWVFDDLEFEEFTADHIPEPSSVAALALGLLAFTGTRRRK